MPPYGREDLREIARQALWGAAGVRMEGEWPGRIDRWADRRSGSQRWACDLAGDFLACMVAWGHLDPGELRYARLRVVKPQDPGEGAVDSVDDQAPVPADPKRGG